MSDKYGIFAQGKLDGVYTWRFSSFGDAEAAAGRLVEEHHIPVIVFEIIGRLTPSVKWTPLEEMP